MNKTARALWPGQSLFLAQNFRPNDFLDLEMRLKCTHKPSSMPKPCQLADVVLMHGQDHHLNKTRASGISVPVFVYIQSLPKTGPKTLLHLNLKRYEKCFCNLGLPCRNDGMQQA
jgi:hypothetical protein